MPPVPCGEDRGGHGQREPGELFRVPPWQADLGGTDRSFVAVDPRSTGAAGDLSFFFWGGDVCFLGLEREEGGVVDLLIRFRMLEGRVCG